MTADDLETLGVDLVEGEHPGSTYYAAELRGDIDEANRAAEAAGIPARFLRAKN
jgi:microcompartment protein CcmL/EutN